MDAAEKWTRIVGEFIGPFMEKAKLAKTVNEKRHIVLAMANIIDAACAHRLKESYQEDFEDIKQFALGKAPLSKLYGAGQKVRAAMSDTDQDPNYGFAMVTHRLAATAVEPDEEADGGFSIRADELPLIMGVLKHFRPSQDALHWERDIGTALLNAIVS